MNAAANHGRAHDLEARMRQLERDVTRVEGLIATEQATGKLILQQMTAHDARLLAHTESMQAKIDSLLAFRERTTVKIGLMWGALGSAVTAAVFKLVGG